MAVFCRAFALCILLLAGGRLAAPTRAPHVLVIACDGASSETIERLGADGALPNLSGVVARGARSEVFGGSRRDPRGFWRAVLSVDATVTGRPQSVWDVAVGQGARSVVIGVPDTEEVVRSNLIVVPGANETDGFVGDNIGRVVDPSGDFAALGWPYADVIPEVFDSARALSPGTASEWIPVAVPGEHQRSGMFRVYHLADGSFYVSPVYRSGRSARMYAPNAPEDLVYVADEPGWTVGSRRLRKYIHDHGRDMVAARAELAKLLGASAPAMLIYFDASIALVREVYVNEDEAEKERVVREAYVALDARIGQLIAVLPKSSAVFVVAREPDETALKTTPRRSGTGFVLSTDDSFRSGRSAALKAREVGAALLRPLHVRDVTSPSDPGAGPETREPGLPLTAKSFLDLGLLPASSTPAAADDKDAAATVKASSTR